MSKGWKVAGIAFNIKVSRKTVSENFQPLDIIINLCQPLPTPSFQKNISVVHFAAISNTVSATFKPSMSDKLSALKLYQIRWSADSEVQKLGNVRSESFIARRTLSPFWSFKIRHTTFQNYIKLADLLILRL